MQLRRTMSLTLALTFFNVFGSHAQQKLKARQADSFVESVGINIHLHYNDTLYGNIQFISKALTDLGVRHYRDGLIDTTWLAYYQHANMLGKLGLHGLFITTASQQTALLRAYPFRVGDTFEGFEYPNELDNDIPALKALTPMIIDAKSRFVVVAPSFTQDSSYRSMGDISAVIDKGNLHNYYGGRNPGTQGWGGTNGNNHAYGSIAYDTDNERQVSGNKPIWVTETGYSNFLNARNHVSEAAAAVYLPRLLLEHWNVGYERTYLYELLTSPNPNEDFGLIARDGRRKPAFFAVQNLLKLLTDSGPAFTPGSLDCDIQGGDQNLHHSLLQTRDGTYYLALWIEAPGWNPDSPWQETPVSAQKVTVRTPFTWQRSAKYQFDAIGRLNITPGSRKASFQVTVSDRLLILKLWRVPFKSPERQAFRVVTTDQAGPEH